MACITFLGMGIMGAPMARHLLKAGHDVTVYNRTYAKAQAWVQANGGACVLTPEEAAQNAEFVFSCVGNDADVEAITIGTHGAFNTMPKGSIFVDHTTTSAEIARTLSAAAITKGLHFLDAPVSGGQAGAENGQLSIMVGGDAQAYARAEPILNTYAKATRNMGPSGAGQLTKMVNQICIAGLLQGLSEGLHFAQKSGLNPMEVVAAISQGAAGSWQMNNRWPTMADDKFDFGFAVDHMRKDLGICLAEAQNNGAQLPITEIINQYYAEIQAMGGGRWDTSSLVKRLK